MASRISCEPSLRFEHVVHRHSKRVANIVQCINARVVTTLRVRHLPDGFATDPGKGGHLSVRQPTTGTLFVKVYTPTQPYRIVGSFFWLPAGYCGYPTIPSLSVVPGCRGRALGTTWAGFFPPGCHIRQSCEPFSEYALLSGERGGDRGIRQAVDARSGICVIFPGFATRSWLKRETGGRWSVSESATSLSVRSWPAHGRRPGRLSTTVGKGRGA